MGNLLDSVNSPSDIKQLSLPKLQQLASEIRERLITVLANTGGHLGPNLGVVELTLAMRAGEEGRLFGSVTNMQLEKALKGRGLNVDRRKIQLDQPIKALGDYEIPVRLSADVTVTLKLSVVPEDGQKASA